MLRGRITIFQCDSQRIDGGLALVIAQRRYRCVLDVLIGFAASDFGQHLHGLGIASLSKSAARLHSHF